MLRPLQLHCIVALMLLFNSIPCVYASTYYISSSRGDDRAAGTSEQSAWRSLARLQQVTLQPGDLVLLRRGDSWNEALLLDKLRGSQEQPIRIADFATGPKPRLQPQQANLALSITHSHYVHVQNLHLMAPSGKKGVRIAGDSRFVKLSYCLVQGHPDATSGHGIVYSALSDGQLPTYPVVEHNEVSFFYEAIIGIGGVKQGGRVAYNYVHTATPTKGSDLIRAIGGDFEGLSIAHNHLTGWYDDAIDLYTGSNVVVEHNRIHTPGQPILGSGNAIKLGGVTNRVAKSPTSYNNVARYNLIYDLTTRPKGKLSNGIDTNGGYNATIYGNLIYNVKGNAINISAPGCKVFNNTAIGERKALYFNPANATLEAYNNILSGGKLDAHVEQASSRILGSNNLLVHSKTQGNYQSKNDRSGDPGFVNAKNHLFSLKPNSIAINAGVQIDEYQKGRQNNSVTGQTDIGCHEHGDNQNTPPKPTPQPSRLPEPTPPPPPAPTPTPEAASGLNYSYYEGSWSKLPDFAKLEAKKKGAVENFSLKPRNRNDNFAFLFQGFITISQAGSYTFYTKSDDGSKLYINGKTIVNNDGTHAAEQRSGKIYLSKGKHAIRVAFFERKGNEVLEVRYAGPGISKKMIPNSVLSGSNDSEPTPAVASKLNYSYYEGSWSKLPDFAKLEAKKKGAVENFSLKPRNRNDNFAFLFQGFITISQAGSYTFYTKSDDGSKLYINGKTIVNNDGTHAAEQRSGKIYLSKGKHAIRVAFFERKGNEVLEVRYAGPGISKKMIPNSVLSGSNDDVASNTRTVAQESRKVIEEANVESKDYNINAYPNPVQSQLAVTLEGTPGESVTLLLMNSMGHTLLKKNIVVFQAKERIILDVQQHLPKAGIFYLAIEQPSGKREILRLVKE